jgi:DNA-binding MarR family transcriptional regulator
MADDAKPVPSTSRLPVQSFEENAGDRIQSLGLVRETFHGMFTIFRLSALVYNDLEGTIFKPAGFSLAGFRVMFILWIADDLEQRDIARLAGVSPAGISSALNTLERNGLVERRRTSIDRRLVTVGLTTKGNDELATAYYAQNAREQEVFGNISPDDLHQLIELMRRVIKTYPRSP